MDKSVLNIDKEQQPERYYLEKILKINNFCEEIETLQINVSSLRNIKKTSIHENLKSENSKESDDTIKSVIVHSSERRLGIYDDLFKSIKENLKDIVYICTILKDINPNPFKEVEQMVILNVLTQLILFLFRMRRLIIKNVVTQQLI